MGDVIEGSVSEIKLEGTMYSFKISGTEEYSIKLKILKEQVRNNVLCLDSDKIKTVEDNKKPRNAVIISQDAEYGFDEKYVTLLASALANGRIVRVKLNEDSAGKIEILSKKYSINSVELLTK